MRFVDGYLCFNEEEFKEITSAEEALRLPIANAILRDEQDLWESVYLVATAPFNGWQTKLTKDATHVARLTPNRKIEDLVKKTPDSILKEFIDAFECNDGVAVFSVDKLNKINEDAVKALQKEDFFKVKKPEYSSKISPLVST